MSRLLSLAGVLLIAVSGCSTAEPSVAPTVNLEPTALPTSSPAVSAAPLATATPEGCPTEQLCAGPVSDGEVSFPVASRTVRFVAGPGWTAQVGAPGVGFELIRHGVDTEAFGVNSFSGVVFADPCSDDPEAASAPATPTGLLDFIGGHDGIQLTDGPTPVSVGTLEGLAAEIAVGPSQACPAATVMAIWRSGRSSIQQVAPGEKARILVLADGDQAIVIVYESYSDDGFQELLSTEGGILDTMSFE